MAPYRAVLAGMIASYPLGGVVWDYGQYALGLEELGFEVTYLEDTAWQTYDPSVGTYSEDPSYGLCILRQALADLSPSLGERWCFRAMDGTDYGPAAPEIEQTVAEADLLVNLSGSAILRPAYLKCPNKVLIDTDPGWNHFRNFPLQDALAAMKRGEVGSAQRLLQRADQNQWASDPHAWLAASQSWARAGDFRSHDHFFTYAQRLGRPGCLLPHFGLPWRRTRPPVVLDRWMPEPPGETWTTVMSWNNFRAPVRYDGVTYGSKETEFPTIEDLPMRTRGSFQVAVAGDDAPRERWRKAGWSVVDGGAVSDTAAAYRRYVQSSRGEISVAKNLYVATASGWFSCRSVCYLAAGRPVVVQDTGFSEFIQTGEGLFAFESGDEALEAIEKVERDYDGNSAAAIAVAKCEFDANKVLGDLLGEVGLG